MQLRRLLDAVLTVGSELDLPVVLRRIAEKATEFVDARYSALGVLDESRTKRSQFITVGIDDEDKATIGHLPEGHGILGLLIVDPKPIRLPDLREHPDSYGFPPNHPPMRSFLGVHTNAVPGRSNRQEVLEVCGDAARVLGFDPVVRFDGPIATGVDECVGEHVLAVVREALSNVARHAQATSVEVRVTARDGVLTVTVEDDGRGLTEQGPGGRGLANMQVRADELGGTLGVGPAPDGTGICLSWTVPIRLD